MTLTPYRTILHPAAAELEIRRSTFITNVLPVVTEEEAEAAIRDKKKASWKANHHCYAYILGKKQEIQKAGDDGEPSGTAGVPILEVLKRRGICDALVIVTRYFGGIKLGAGGLIRAYSNAASAGLRAAEIVDQIPSDLWQISVDYHLSGMLDNKLHSASCRIRNVQYSDCVSYEVYTDQTESAAFRLWINDLTNGRAEFKHMGELYLHQAVSESDE